MNTFNVPTREEVSANNQAIFDNLKSQIGFVPNLYATMAYSENVLGDYLQFQGGKTSLSNKEKEIVNLVVSEVNECKYCLSAHTAIGKMNGFTEEQTIELRQGAASWDAKYDALVKLAKEVTENKGKIATETLDAFFAASYDKGTLVDVIKQVGDKVIMNYLHNLTNIPVDFPEAKELSLQNS